MRTSGRSAVLILRFYRSGPVATPLPLGEERCDLMHDPLGALREHIAVEAPARQMRQLKGRSDADIDGGAVRESAASGEDPAAATDADRNERSTAAHGQQRHAELRLAEDAVA